MHTGVLMTFRLTISIVSLGCSAIYRIFCSRPLTKRAGSLQAADRPIFCDLSGAKNCWHGILSADWTQSTELTYEAMNPTTAILSC
jgi:hypothetical protein